MKKLFSLLIIAMSILVSCQKKSVEPIPAPVNSVVNPLSLTDSTKLALFNTTFTVVADYLFGNQNAAFVDTAYGYRKMHDVWTINSAGSCTVIPYTYYCYNNYIYNENNFPFIINQYSSPIIFDITIHGDTIDLPWNTPIDWNRVDINNSTFSINKLIYKKSDPSGNGSRCFETLPLNNNPNLINRYSIK